MSYPVKEDQSAHHRWARQCWKKYNYSGLVSI